MREHTLTSRSRNLGLGWSNMPGRQSLEIVPLSTPDASGGLRAIESELARAQRLNSGNFWSARLFVAGALIASRWGVYWAGDDYREGWVRVSSRDEIATVLTELREGLAVRVRTEED